MTCITFTRFFLFVTAAAMLNLPMTINDDQAQLKISTARVKRVLHRKVPLNDCNPENTVIVENIPCCDSSLLEMYVASETQVKRAHLMRTDELSSALIARLQGM